MNYEQKYNEMVQRARELHEAGNFLTKQQMEIVCPELRESEDERIRKALICGLSEGLSEHNWQGFGGATIDECLAWLEKQKEQKPAEWSDNDDQLIGFIFDLLNDLVWRKDWAMSKEECLERLKSLRPSWKPSEEQPELELTEDLEEAAEKYAHSLGYDEGKERLEIVTAKEDFIAGAEYQRKQDLARTWEDIRLICEIDEDMRCHSDWPLLCQEVYYEEVLRRFREMKNK